MRKTLLAVIAAGALVCGSMAFAAPKVLSGAELDKVSAGSGILDWFLNTPTTTPQGTGSAVADESAVAEAEDAEHTIAVAGSEESTQQVAGALAAEQGIATSGEDNEVEVEEGNFVEGDGVAGEGNEFTKVDQEDADYALTAGDNTQVELVSNSIDAEVEEGSAAVAGNNNQVTVTSEEIEIDGEIEDGGYGVIAKEAQVTDSFNVKKVEIDVEVDIEDSFNVTTNTLDISGQVNLNAIINANTLGDQMIGANLNVTNATATLTASDNGEEEIPVGPASAFATTCLNQYVINNSTIVSGLLFDNVD